MTEGKSACAFFSGKCPQGRKTLKIASIKRRGHLSIGKVCLRMTENGCSFYSNCIEKFGVSLDTLADLSIYLMKINVLKKIL